VVVVHLVVVVVKLWVVVVMLVMHGGQSRRELEFLRLGFREMSQLVVLLPLHPPVLEPDFDLPLGEVERVRNLNPAPAREVAVEVELFLQLEGLMSGVRRAGSLGLGPIHAICKHRKQTMGN
jgi:hypothetical protein